MTARCIFYPPDVYRERDNNRIAAMALLRKQRGLNQYAWNDEIRALSDSFFPPGSMWLCPGYHDPNDPDDMADLDQVIAATQADPGGHTKMLSVHYWTTWAKVRPPIMVICPGGGHWCPDQKSSNGSGWTVTGEPPNITCSPSIWVNQGQGSPREYHGYLQNGVFTPPL